MVLEKVLRGDNQDTVVAELVSYLQGTSYSISDLLCDAAGLKEKIASAHLPVEQMIDGWNAIDRTVGNCLTLTSIVHEKFIEQTLHAFCEFDQSGVITYANAKMLELAPRCIGHDISEYLGKIATEIRATLITKGPRRLHQIDLNANGRSYPVLAEFGKIESNTHSSRYALLVDLSEQVESEHKTLEAAPYGMLKLNGKHRIVYANQKAVEMFGCPLERLLGQDARRFITNKDSLREVLRQNVQRRKGRGGQCEILFTKVVTGESIHLRASSIPLFDPCGSVTGTLTALEPIDHEIGRADISRLIAMETDYNKLFVELMKIVARFVPFDWANLSLRTEGGDYSLTICNYPEPKEPYYTRWFEIPEGFRNWLDRPQTWVDDLPSYLSETSEGQALLQNPDTKRYLDDGLRSIFAMPVRARGRIIGSLSLMSKQRALYGEETKGTLTRLALDQSLHAVFNARERAERDFISALVRDISTVTNHKALAQTVVDQIANFYWFRHVSIFKVNALRGRFSILAQAAGRPDGVTLPDDYTQALDSGLLGRARQQQRPVILKDVNDCSEEAQRFIRVAAGTTSELCVPIKLRGRVLWILNLEDQQSNAFTMVEVRTIDRIIGQIEKTLESLFKSLVLDQVLEVFPEAIVIMELNGRILECNKAALTMFELESFAGHEDIWTFLPDAPWLARPAEGAFVTEKATVVGASGKKNSGSRLEIHLTRGIRPLRPEAAGRKRAAVADRSRAPQGGPC
jgi:PAS domain S-box-containing protein